MVAKRGKEGEGLGAFSGDAKAPGRRRPARPLLVVAGGLAAAGITACVLTTLADRPVDGAWHAEEEPAPVAEPCADVGHWGFRGGERLERCITAALADAALSPGDPAALSLAGDVLLYSGDRDALAAKYYEAALTARRWCTSRRAPAAENMLCISDFQSWVTALRRAGADAAVAEALASARMIPRMPSWSDPLQIPVNFDASLEARPFWSTSEIELARLLEEHAAEIQAELDAVLDAGRHFQRPAAAAGTLMLSGSWTELALKYDGRWHSACEEAMPRTCALLKGRPEISGFVPGRFNNVSVPFVKVYRQEPGTRLRPHYGMSNARLTAHLGLRAPPGASAGLRVGSESRTWRGSEVIVFDDSFEHEAWNRHSELPRYVLNVGFWHPGLHSLLEMPSLAA